MSQALARCSRAVWSLRQCVRPVRPCSGRGCRRVASAGANGGRDAPAAASPAAPEAPPPLSKLPPQPPRADLYKPGHFDFGSPEYWDKFYARKLAAAAPSPPPPATRGAAASARPASSPAAPTAAAPTTPGADAGDDGCGWFEWFESAVAVYPAVEAVARRLTNTAFCAAAAGGGGGGSRAAVSSAASAPFASFRPPLRVLHVGAGTSALGLHLAEAGHAVVNIDICVAAVDFAASKLRELGDASPGAAGLAHGAAAGAGDDWAGAAAAAAVVPGRAAAGAGAAAETAAVVDTAAAAAAAAAVAVGPRGGTCTYQLLDVLDMERAFGSGSFDLLVDKGTLDALLFRDDDAAQEMCRQAHAVLRPGGIYCQITREDPELRLDAFHGPGLPDWDVAWQPLDSGGGGAGEGGRGGIFDETSFMFVCTKKAHAGQ